MISLTKRERYIILFLIVTFILGVGLRYFNGDRHHSEKVSVTKRSPADAELDAIIEQEETININTADMNRLMRLPGVGPKYAERIIEYRQVHGGFEKPEDIKHINGIGEKKFEKIKGMITVE